MWDKVLYSSKKMDWRTPQKLFDELNERFHFTLDAAASPENAKCEKYFTEEQDALKQSWQTEGAVWCNPPYGKTVYDWVKKAYEESQKWGGTIVMLLNCRTDTKWFHEWVWHKAEIEFIKGRLRFEDENGAAGDQAPFASIIVIYRGRKE